MNIQDNKHYVTIPKKDYEEMVAAINDSKNIRVRFELSVIDYYGYGHVSSREVYCYSNVYEINENKVNEDLINETARLIEECCKEVANKKDKQITEIAKKLEGIYCKWWYKFFA